MTAIAVDSPYTQFFDLNGSPLDDGSIYIGEKDKNPKDPSNQIPVFWDVDLTQPAAQPIKVMDGYIYRYGTPANIYANGAYSISIYDKKQRLISYSKSALSEGIFGVLSSSSGSSLVGYDGGVVQDVLDYNKPLSNYNALRSYTGRAYSIRLTQTGIAGPFWRDDSDTTSSDNGITTIVDASGRRWKRLYDGTASVKWASAKLDGTTDDSAALNAALSCGALAVDFLGLNGKINTSLTIPAGIEARNINLTAGTAGMNMVLVNSRSKLSGTLTGTGTVSIVERGIYPAADGVEDVELNVTVQNMTFGVQAQPIGTNTYANMPKRWRGVIVAKNIVGTVGASEGYGLLLSPAMECNLHVQAFNIQRHAVYLSAGAVHNIVDAQIDGCKNVAVQFNTGGTQPASEFNTIRAKIRNVTVPSGQGANQAVGVYILGNSHRNTIHIDMDGAGTAEMAAVCEGVATDTTQQPTGNIISGHIKGQFIGADVVRDLGAAQNDYSGLVIDAYATFSVIALRLNGVRGAQAPWSGPRAFNNRIKALGQSIIGVYDEVTDVVTVVDGNDIRNNGTGARVQDNTGGKRQGSNRRVTFSGTTGSIGATTVGDTTVDLADPVAVAGRRTHVAITNASVTLVPNSNVTAILTPASEGVCTFRIYNAHSASQTFSYEGWVEGD
jgi:hypothetical protein